MFFLLDVKVSGVKAKKVGSRDVKGNVCVCV